jgi:O-antigen/teichoic acid export membrane protein
VPPIIIGLAIYGRLISKFAVRFSKSILGPILHFGSPLVPMHLAMWILSYSDIYLLRRLAVAGALSEVGLYQYAHEICLVLVLPITSFNLAWPQFLFAHHTKPEAAGMFARVQVYFTFLLVALGFLLSVFSHGIIRLVGSSQYIGSAEVMPYLAGSLVFYGFSIIFASGLYATGKTRILAGVVASSAALNVGLNLLLIPEMGKRGAAIATLVTNLVMALAVLAFAQSRYRIPFRLTRSLAAVMIGGVILAVLGGLDVGDLGRGLLVRAAVACGFVLVLLAVLGMNLRDLATGLRMLASLAKPSPRQ